MNPTTTCHWRHGALAVLKELYDTKPAEELQFVIELATVNANRTAYEKLKSPCGTFISMLSPAPSYYAQPKERSVIFTYDYHSGLPNHEFSPSLVLVHQGTQKRVVHPSELRIRGGGTGGGSNSVVLPKDLPAGRYHVFFEVSEGDKVISTGHFFAADL